MTGIYKIVSPDGAIYIGQSLDIEKRFAQYRRMRGKTQKKLYNSFIEHGAYNHRFEILEECEEINLNFRERHWWNIFKPTLNSNIPPSGPYKRKDTQKWKPIDCFSGYMISTHGIIKRTKHRTKGKRHRILPESIIKQHMNKQGTVYVNILSDERKRTVISVQKLIIRTFLPPGRTYYKLVDDPFNNRVDMFLDASVYDRMKDPPQIFKIIKT